MFKPRMILFDYGQTFVDKDEYNGIELSLLNSEIGKVFWDYTAYDKPTEEINDFLAYLASTSIIYRC